MVAVPSGNIDRGDHRAIHNFVSNHFKNHICVVSLRL